MNSAELESELMMNSKAILKEIKKVRKLWVLGHIDPDGDAISSVLLAGRLLEHLGKEYALLLFNKYADKFSFLKGVDKIAHELPTWMPDAILTVDTTDPPRLGFNLPDIKIINVDHHPSNTKFGRFNWVQSERTAACLMVYELLKTAHVPITVHEGEMVFAGLYTETGGFSYPNTTVEAFQVCAEVVELGVGASDIALRMTARDEKNLTLLGAVLATLKIIHGIAIIELTEKMLAKVGLNHSQHDSDSYIRYPVSIPGVKIAIFFREYSEINEIRMSFRSVKGTDVNQLAAKFGGGGHENAAGARVKGSFAEVKRRVIAEAKEYLGVHDN